MGNVFSALVSKITTFPGDTDPAHVEELLSRLENNVPSIVALIKSDPDNTEWTNASLDELVVKAESHELSDQETHVGTPWWFNRAGIRDQDWDKVEGGLLDLDAVVTDVSAVLEGAQSERMRQAGEAALKKLLRLKKDKRGDSGNASKQLIDRVRDMFDKD